MKMKGSSTRADLVPGALPADPHRIGAGDRRRGVGGKPDRRRHVGHQAEIEDEHVHGDQRHREVVLRPPARPPPAPSASRPRRSSPSSACPVPRMRQIDADQHQHDDDVAAATGTRRSRSSRRPMPVSVTVPTMMPAVAVAMPTAVMLRAPSSRPSTRSQPARRASAAAMSPCRRKNAVSGFCVSTMPTMATVAPEGGEARRHLLDHQAPDQHRRRAAGSAGRCARSRRSPAPRSGLASDRRAARSG